MRRRNRSRPLRLASFRLTTGVPFLEGYGYENDCENDENGHEHDAHEEENLDVVGNDKVSVDVCISRKLGVNVIVHLAKAGPKLILRYVFIHNGA